MDSAKKNCVATIVTSNYLQFAEILFKSFRKYNNDEFILLICDEYRSSSSHYLNKYDWLKESTVLFLDDLSLKNIDFLIKSSTAFEFSNILKPSLIKHLFNNHEKVIYFDSDVFIHDKIECIFSELNDNPVCFTRHLKRPLPFDSHKPTDLDYNLFGWINGGFWALRKSPISLLVLDFLEERIHKFGLFDVENGMFVDQKFLDAAFILFYPDIHIIDNERLNLGYWNIHEGTIENRNETFFFNGKRVIFFHMSCFDFKSKSFRKTLTRWTENPNHKAITALFNYYYNLFNNTSKYNESYKFTEIDGFTRDVIERRYFYKHLKYPKRFIVTMVKLLLLVKRAADKILRKNMFFR